MSLGLTLLHFGTLDLNSKGDPEPGSLKILDWKHSLPLLVYT